ncbi:heme uptake protein IsdC [Virgibacillus pantothenticus]|uniref:heme uptake protein IsdC n=1 Tax=Virgibacillus pantothenticus TaxID=1473 RepID=UPI001B122E97|nr:heme uptake protein IsdC [Virgibacillus pantothenticus]GIP62754.1 heme uptake protein IsdC [Virgibacillus pantothenticus]
MKKITIPFFIILITFFSFHANQVNAASTYAEGEYNLPFTVLKGDTDERSMTNDYLVSPAKLIVKNGKNLVQITLKNSSWWQSFHVQSKPVTVVSEGNDTRVVQFEVPDLDQIVNATIHVIVPDIDYDNKYKVRFQFDTSGLAANQNQATSTNEDKADNVSAKNEKLDNNQNIGTKQKAEKNPKTSDETPIVLFVVALLASGFILIRKFAVK